MSTNLWRRVLPRHQSQYVPPFIWRVEYADSYTNSYERVSYESECSFFHAHCLLIVYFVIPCLEAPSQNRVGFTNVVVTSLSPMLLAYERFLGSNISGCFGFQNARGGDLHLSSSPDSSHNLKSTQGQDNKCVSIACHSRIWSSHKLISVLSGTAKMLRIACVAVRSRVLEISTASWSPLGMRAVAVMTSCF